MQVCEKLEGLRAAMVAENVDALIIGNSDPHNNEQVAPRWRCREWVSHMKGSSGVVVLTADWCGLWADSRYYEAAEDALEGTEIELVRMSDMGVDPLEKWLSKNLSEGQTVAFNGEDVSLELARKYLKQCKRAKLNTKTDLDFVDPLWVDRPAAPKGELYIVSDEMVGQSIADKIADVQKEMADQKLDAFLFGRTDESCWLLNFRGDDVPNNPTPYCYTLVTTDAVFFFVDPDKLTVEAVEKFTSAGVTLKEYGALEAHLKELSKEVSILTIPRYLNYRLATAVEHCEVVESRSIATDLKGVKNATEIANFKAVLIDDGVAMVKFFVELYGRLKRGEKVTELSASNLLEECRASMPGFRYPSFTSIMGYGPDGALNHYSVDETTDKEVKLENIFLIDSGGNYAHGTTDTTRTIPMGGPTELQKEDYTCVLSSFITLMTTKFCEGTTGAQLDGICRVPLWERERNFKHGTGHGIGFGLEVHEGPQNISGLSLEKFILGQVTTIEPGCYRPGQHGIRIENMVHTVLSAENEFGRFFEFENLTLCPINTDLIKKEFLSESQITWLNSYHEEVLEKLSPMLNDEQKAWLVNECRAI